MPSTRNSNNTAINMDLEEGLAATSSPPPPSSNRNSARSAAAFSPGNGPSLLAGSHHLRTTDRQPDGAEVEVAAAATAPSATFPATSNDRGGPGPELVDGAGDLPLPIGMIEEGLAEADRNSARSAAAFSPGNGPSLLAGSHHLRTTDRQSDGAEVEVAAAATAPAAITALNYGRTGIELADDNSTGPPLPTGMIEEALAKGSSASAASIPPLGFAAASSSEGQARPSGLEIMDDHGPTLPVGMIDGGDQDKGKKKAQVETIQDDSGPNPPLASIEEMNAKVNLVNNLSPPTPFNPSAQKASLSSDVDSIVHPREDFEEDNQPLTTMVANEGFASHNNNPPLTSAINSLHTGLVDADNVEEERNDGNDYLDEEEGINPNNNSQAANEEEEDAAVVRRFDEEDPSVQVIPDAYPVDDIVLGHAVPLLPWWKQRRTKLMIGAFLLLLFVLAVSLGVPLSQRTATTLVFNTDFPSESPTGKPSGAPSTTSSPSYDHSDSPSASLAPTALPSIQPTSTPSYSPSSCEDQISSNVKKINLPIDDPYYPKVAVDGENMFVVAQQGGWDGLSFIMFYTLINGEWQQRNILQDDRSAELSSVALSDNIAFVGFMEANDNAGAVAVYEKDQYGDWDLMEDPFIHDANVTHSRFGSHVDIDGELACVEDDSGTYLYRRDNSKWFQLDGIIDEYGCSIAGDTIATWAFNSRWGDHMRLYRYNQEFDGVVPIQDQNSTNIQSLDLSNDYVVYWDWVEDDAFVYHREDTNKTYIFHQQLNISDPSTFFEDEGLAIGNEILVVRGNDKTHIFFKQNYGKWEETITLDQSYHSYALSGRSLFATKGWPDHELYYFDIEGCFQATQTPSLYPSMSPSLTMEPSSSLSPTMSPSSTTAPSSSFSPTETCHRIQVTITYDSYPEDTSWRIDAVVYEFQSAVHQRVKHHNGSDGDTSYVESICLEEGEYSFTIYDLNGICCDNGVGNYNVTSDGMLIVKGGEFEGAEQTYFSLPFVPSSL